MEFRSGTNKCVSYLNYDVRTGLYKELTKYIQVLTIFSKQRESVLVRFYQVLQLVMTSDKAAGSFSRGPSCTCPLVSASSWKQSIIRSRASFGMQLPPFYSKIEMSA